MQHTDTGRTVRGYQLPGLGTPAGSLLRVASEQRRTVGADATGSGIAAPCGDASIRSDALERKSAAVRGRKHV